MTQLAKDMLHLPEYHGRVNERLFRVEDFEGFEVAQYQVYLVDSGRVLGYAVKVTFLHDRPTTQEQVELEPTRNCHATQFLMAKEFGYDQTQETPEPPECPF